MKTINSSREELKEILEQHELWLNDNENGKRANLRAADLDFSCFPLWCGSFDTKVSIDFIYQLCYHICRLNCEEDEALKIQDLLKEFANKSKIIKGHNMEEIK